MPAQAPSMPHDPVGELVDQARGWRELLGQLKAGHATSSEVELAFMLFQNKGGIRPGVTKGGSGPARPCEDAEPNLEAAM